METYLEKCVFRFNNSIVFGVGLPMESSILFGRCLRLPLLPFFVVVSLLRWLQMRRLLTIKSETLFSIIVPRPLVPDACKLLRVFETRALPCDVWCVLCIEFIYLFIFSKIII